MLEKRVTSVDLLRQELSRRFEAEELDNAQGVTDTLEELCVTPILEESSFPLFFHDVKKGEKGLLREVRRGLPPAGCRTKPVNDFSPPLSGGSQTPKSPTYYNFRFAQPLLRPETGNKFLAATTAVLKRALWGRGTL